MVSYNDKEISSGRGGFVLPTVIISSVIMMSLLALSLQITAASSRVLAEQYFMKISQEAAEAGAQHAKDCIERNGYQAGWTDSRPLRPNTDCSGNASGADGYVLQSSDVRSSYQVSRPVVANGIQRVQVEGRTDRLRISDKAVFGSYTSSKSAVVGGSVSFQNIVFGYDQSNGAFFSTVYPSGRVMALGLNRSGQLGNGSAAWSALSPEQFQLPSGKRGIMAFTDFLSAGRSLYVVTDDGELWGAGRDDYGQHGTGGTSSRRSIPVKYRLPNGVSAKYVSMLQETTFVIGSDNNIYSSGRCIQGVIGDGTSCSTFRSWPVRVALPTPNPADPNTIPVAFSTSSQSDNIVSDGNTIVVRMEGGAVYGWGSNTFGQLGNSSFTETSTPVRIGSFGMPGQSKATKLAFDGDALYVIDDRGDAYATGRNMEGALAGAGTPLKNYGTNGSDGLCIDNPGNSTASGTRLRVYACNKSTAQKLEWTPWAAGANGGAIRFRPNSTTELCLDNASGSSANGNRIMTYTCNNGAAQNWILRQQGNSLFNPASGKCIDIASDKNLQLYSCNNTANQWWMIQDSFGLQKIPSPGGRKFASVTTDQWSVLFRMTDGTVWGAGANGYGQLGLGAVADPNTALKQYVLPAGSTAVDVYTTRFSSLANTFVVLSNGQVWGSGSNSYGQLGFGITSSYEARPRRMLLPTGFNARTVQTGSGTTAILTTDGKIFTVGNNNNGQLGDGTTTSNPNPRQNKYTNDIPIIIY